MLPETVSQARAREIMGKNFFGTEDVAKYYNVTYNPEQLLAFEEVPFSEATLEFRKHTHVLVAGFPMTTLEIRAKMRERFLSQEGGWYKKEPFVINECVKLRWYLFSKNVVPNSAGKDFQGQTLLLSQEEEVPRVVEFLYVTLLYLFAREEQLFLNVYIRCSDLDRDGMRAEIIFDSNAGIRFNNSWDTAMWPELAIVSSRRPYQ